MLRRIVGIASIVVLAGLLQPTVAAFAKTALAKIQSAAAHAIGASSDTVEVAVNGDVLAVLRVNSKMNFSTHAARVTEANAIVAALGKILPKSPEFKNLATIRVQYIERGEKDANSTVVDSIEFQKTPDGTFGSPKS